MKKVIFIFTILIIILTCSCSPVKQNTYKDYNTDYYAVKEIVYSTFEEAIKSSTHIIKAKFEYYEEYDTYYSYLFKIEKQYKGNIEENYLYVYAEKCYVSVSSKDYFFNNSSEYVEGESYVLLLTRHISVYNQNDRYLVVSGSFLPVNNLDSFGMYGDSNIKAHSDMSFIDLWSFKRFEKYLLKEIKKNPIHEEGYYGSDYIHSSDLNEIIENSGYVVRIKIIRQNLYAFDFDTEVCECEILKQYKGKIEKETVEIRFPLDTVHLDGEYIVALDSSFISIYRFSSKNSLIDINRESDVLQCINE